MNTHRTAAACAALAALVVAPALSAAPIATTIRVEGGGANILPETPVTVDDTAGATTLVDDTTDADAIGVAQNSATAQLANATVRFGLPLGFDIFNFGGPSSFVTRIGPDAMPASFNPSWRLKVNGRITSTGADTTTLAAGDVATWSFVSDFTARELDLKLSGDKLTVGQSVTATVTSIDNDGSASPAAGATVTFGDQVTAADAAGKAVLSATTPGVKLISATRPGEVRSQARAVCTYAADPTVCQLPPASAAPTPTTPMSAVDTVAPGSVVLFPISGRRYSSVTALRGSAGPDRSDIATVEVAIARRIGTQCSFMGPKGRFSAPRSCVERRLLPATSSGGRWIYALPVRLNPGKYRAWSRATDGSGNREQVGLNTINAISFSIVPKGNR